MRTVLRRKENGLYFQGPDQWTNDPADAFDFKMIDRAIGFVRKWGLKDVEVAFCFKDRHCITGVPLEKMSVGFSER